MRSVCALSFLWKTEFRVLPFIIEVDTRSADFFDPDATQHYAYLRVEIDEISAMVHGTRTNRTHNTRKYLILI